MKLPILSACIRKLGEASGMHNKFSDLAPHVKLVDCNCNHLVSEMVAVEVVPHQGLLAKHSDHYYWVSGVGNTSMRLLR